jgi:CHAT domain-containing protein
MDLPDAELEVKAIRRSFPAASVFTRADAASARLTGMAPERGIVHVAAHAELDRVDPIYSALYLAGPNPREGRLEAHDIYSLDLTGTSLVVLSACGTGMGRVARGDEFQGFTRAFFGAGAGNLVVTLWPIADTSTAALMTRFYTRLNALGPARALQAAQADLARDPKFADPLYWAAFTLQSRSTPQLRS